MERLTCKNLFGEISAERIQTSHKQELDFTTVRDGALAILHIQILATSTLSHLQATRLLAKCKLTQTKEVQVQTM